MRYPIFPFHQLLSIFLLYPHTLVRAAPAPALPLNAQVPPVAVALKPYSFEFSASTFLSVDSTISYTLDDAPSWLLLKSSTRTLMGSPSLSDIGTVSFNLKATDDTGSTSMPVKLVVTAEEGPQLNASKNPLFQTSGVTTTTGEILYYPSQPISVLFPNGTFLNTDPNTIFYATSANNTPLPSWLKFDAPSLSFTGSTPPATSSSQRPETFAVRLSASNIAGYYTAQTTFSIIVENHELYFKSMLYNIVAPPGQRVTYAGLQNMLLLNGAPVPSSALRSVKAVTPAWLSFDEKTFTFSGIAPINSRNGSVAVTAEDIYGDTANATVSVTFGPEQELILKQIGPLTAIIGRNFSFEISRDTFAPGNLSTTCTLGTASSWLSYDNSTRVLSGQVPGNLGPSPIDVIINASENDNTQTQAIVINLIRGHSRENGIPSTSPHHTAPTNQPPARPPSSDINAVEDRLRLAAAIILPIIVVLALILLICCLRSRRSAKKRKDHSWSKKAPQASFLDWFFKPPSASRKHQAPKGIRYSVTERGTTPAFGTGKAPQITDLAFGFKKPPIRPPRPPPHLSDVGQFSRPGSFVSQLAHSRWSFQNSPLDTATNANSQNTASTHGGAAAIHQVGPLAPNNNPRQHERNNVPSNTRLGITGNRGTNQSIPRMSQSLGRGRAGQRSVHGCGHGRPFPEQELNPTRDGAVLSRGSVAWTDTTGSSHGAMNSASSQGSYVGYPQRVQLSRNVVPQTVRLDRPTIRPIDPSSSQNDQLPEETTAGIPSTPRPPSYQHYIHARNEAVRRLREKDSTSFSGYRPTRKTSASKSSPSKDTASTSGEEAPIVPPRLRPALDIEEVERISAFYSSRNASTSAQRKGSLIHNRFQESCSRTPKSDISNFRWDFASGPSDQLPMTPDHDSSGARSIPYENTHLETELSDVALSSARFSEEMPEYRQGSISVPAPLRLAGTWTATEERPARRFVTDDRSRRSISSLTPEEDERADPACFSPMPPEEDEEAEEDEGGEDDSLIDFRSTPSPREAQAISIIPRRPVGVGSRVQERRDQPPSSPANENQVAERSRDTSMRFL